MLNKAYILLILLLPYGLPAAITTLQDKWQHLYQQSWKALPVTIPRKKLDAYPPQLLLASSQYPDFATFSWQDIMTLRQVAQHCTPAAQYNKKLKDAIRFELALCRQQTLNIRWFSGHALRHPAGGSYTDRYTRNKPRLLSSGEFTRFLTADHPQHPLHQAFSLLSPHGRDQLLKGAQAWLEGDTLWLNGKPGWKQIPASVWQPLAKQLKLTLSDQQTSCALRYNNLCLNERPEQPVFQWILVLLLLLGLTALLLNSLYQKHQQNREKRFILQLLTHELRTPITSLGLTVEMFRHEFDQLNQATQQALWRLISDYQRLSQIADVSQGYLSPDKTQQFIIHQASLNDWLTYICEKHTHEKSGNGKQTEKGQWLTFSLDQDAELTLPYYWLAICLENLIKNALQHGRPPVHIHATITEKLTIKVGDQGHFPPAISQLVMNRKTCSGPENMGIGLTLTRRLMKQMGGKLIIRRSPTCCILELPL